MAAFFPIFLSIFPRGFLILFFFLTFLMGCDSKGPSSSPDAAPQGVLIQVDADQRYQTMLGFGAYLGRFDDPHMLYTAAQKAHPKDQVPSSHKEEILDLVYNDLGLDTISIGIRRTLSSSYDGWKSWEPVNDDNDPNTINWNALKFDPTYWDGLLRSVQGAEARIKARGAKPLFMIKVGWELETWMTGANGNNLSSAMAAEFAEWVLEFILFAEKNYGLAVDTVSVMNEPDANGAMNPATMVTVVKAMADLFSKAGVSTQLAGPETYLPSTAPAYLSAILADPLAASSLKLVTYHIYDRDLSVGDAGDTQAREQIKNLAAQLNAPVLESEISSCCKQNIDTFWNDTFNQALAWANDFYNEIVLTGAAGIDMQTAFWSDTSAYVRLFFDANKNYTGYNVSKFFYPLGQFIRFIEQGMVRIDAKSEDANVLPLAFVDPPNQSAVLVIINNNPNPTDITLNFGSSAPAALAAIRSSETENWKYVGSQGKQNGLFFFTLAPKSITTFFSGKGSGFPAP